MPKLESGSELKHKMEKRKAETDDRARHMEGVKDDKKIVAETSHKLRLEGTKEGAEAIKREIKQAAENTHREFERQNQDIEKKLQACKEAEKDLHERTDASKHNVQEVRHEQQRMKEVKDARAAMESTEKAATEDARVTEDMERAQKRNREHSERRRNEQKSQLHAAKLKW